MIKYASSIEKAKEIAAKMKQEEKEYAKDVEISETYEEEDASQVPEIYRRTHYTRKFVIHNETE